MNRAILIFCITISAVLDHRRFVTATHYVDEKSEIEACGCSGSGLERSKIILEDVGKDESSHALQKQCHNSRNDKVHSDLFGGNMVTIPGGSFKMGLQSAIIGSDGETPVRNINISTFLLDKFEVSNAAFAEFVDSTSFKTDSEIYGWSFVFHSAIPPHIKKTIRQAVKGAEWWLPVQGASWKNPEGPGSDVIATNRSNHPVVHISWNDAVQFCAWRNQSRLPTEAEWEYAAIGPVQDAKSTTLYPWGSKLLSKRVHRANIYQGSFPNHNSAEDGYEFLAPVDAFPPQNGYGLHNMIGNAWEWVSDWWTTQHEVPGRGGYLLDPQGPADGVPGGMNKVQKGGSFLCHRSYCYRYRVAARHKSTADSATYNTGFRCAKQLEQS